MKAKLLLLLLLTAAITQAQNNKDKAYDKGMEGIKLMDEGKYEESVALLKEAQKLDPERFDYPYEIAYASYLQKDYEGTIKQLKKIEDHKNVTQRFFQLLGNSYDYLGKEKEAFEAYDAGLKKFPKSGMMWLEKGNVYWTKKEYGKALGYYEKGIEAEPRFPSNYYRATLIYCNSSEEVWGMIYGEIFVNLERNTKRTAEISKLLFDTYKQGITFTDSGGGKTSMGVSFSKVATVDVKDLTKKNFKLPFGMGVYEMTLMLSMLSAEQTVTLASMDHMRSAFVDNYFKQKHDKDYPNVLFSYQQEVKKAGHMEAYNYWVLMKGDEAEFTRWSTANKEKFQYFVKQYTDNPLKITEENKFFTAQY